MKTSLDCIPCLVRQTLGAARMVTPDPALHESILRDLLGWLHQMDLNQSPPAMAQRIHRRLRDLLGVDDPYREAKDLQNQMAQKLLPELEAQVESAADPLAMAVHLAIAGNIIDLGAQVRVGRHELMKSIRSVLDETIFGDLSAFRRAIDKAQNILYLADNAGEIVFDRLLLSQLPPGKTRLAVRGGPAINDATLPDALFAGIQDLAELIDNGSDAPGTLLDQCSPGFIRAFQSADLIIAKGQGNYETLTDATGKLFFLFKVKCEVIADHSGLPLGACALLQPKNK